MCAVWVCVAGKQLQVRPMFEAPGELEPEAAGPRHAWSEGSLDGAHALPLDALDEGVTMLARCRRAAGDPAASGAPSHWLSQSCGVSHATSNSYFLWKSVQCLKSANCEN